MAAQPSGPGVGLGARLRQVRTGRALSVRELARRAGCSPSLISQIERGHSAPSAGILYALANELSISLDYLFGVNGLANPAPGGASVPLDGAGPSGGTGASPHAWGRAAGADGVGILLRADQRRRIDLSSGVRWERLTPTTDERVDFLEVVYAPHGRSSDTDRSVRHDGREYQLVLEGTLTAEIGFETYELATGDSLAFDPLTPHQYRNATGQVTRCLSVIVHDPQ